MAGYRDAEEDALRADKRRALRLQAEMEQTREKALQEAAAACVLRARRHNSRARLEEATDCANAVLALIGRAP